MPTYVMLINYTPQGVEKIKESPARLDAAKKAFQTVGVELKEVYLVMGQYDLVTIVDAPNDEAVAKAVLALASLGNVSTQTLRAFTEEEFRRIIAALP